MGPAFLRREDRVSDNALAGLIHSRDAAQFSLRLAYMRWWFLAVLAATVVSAPIFLGVALPAALLLSVLALLAVSNAITGWRNSKAVHGAAGLLGQLCIDLIGLGVLLYLSGGAANPLVSLLLFPVAVAALALPGHQVAVVTVIAISIYSALMIFFLPLEIADIERASRLHLIGMWLTFVVSACMAAWFVTRMTASIRTRDAQLAAAREKALRDAQVIALGQLAAGAAHELGTPLGTMSILAGELQQDDRLPVDLRSDVEILRKQIHACKDIVGGMTAKAGIARAEELRCVSVATWLEKLLARWHTLWPQASYRFTVDGAGCPPLICVEVTLEQAVINLLNNAARSASDDVLLALSWDENQISIEVCDHGAGFSESVLRIAGTEPLSVSTGGNGIGLWLTRTAVERFGGCLELENRGGGLARLILPRVREK